MTELTDRVDRKRRVNAWSGTAEQLLRAMNAVDSHIARHRDSLARAPGAATRRIWNNDLYLDGLKYWKTSSQLWVREKATGDITNRSGDLEAIFEGLHDRQIVAAKIEFMSDAELNIDCGTGELTFMQDKVLPGYRGGLIELTLRRSPPDFSAQLADSVYRELGECVPYWQALRTTVGRYAAIAVCSSLLFFATFLILQPAPVAVRWMASLVVGSAGLTLVNRRMFGWFLPAFEVRSGSVGTGSRNLGFLGASVFLALLVGVVVNRLS